MRVELRIVVTSAASKSGRLLAAAVCAGACVHLLYSPVQAGEKIQITKTPGAVDLPQDAAKETPDSGLFRSRISPSDMQQGPVLPMPSQPSYLRNPMIEDLYGRKKNWMLNSPSSVDRDKTLREIFGVREYDTSAFSKKPKNDFERMFDDSSRPASNKDKNFNRSTDPDPDSRFGQTRSEDPSSRFRAGEDFSKDSIPNIIPALNPAPLFKWGAGPDLDSQDDSLNRNSILPPTLTDPVFGQKPFTSAPAQSVNPTTARTFDPMFDPRKTPLGSLSDPINSQGDGTRFAINPIGPRRNSAVLPDSSASSSAAAEPMVGFATTPPIGTRPDLFGPTRAISGPMGFTPTAPLPAGSQIMAPKPAVLEIPRPRF